MALNFKEALATLDRGLAAVLVRAGILAAGGFATIIAFAMLLFAYRVAGGSSTAVAIIALLSFLGWALSGSVARRFFLFRYRAAMLLLFSGRGLAAPGLAAAIKEGRSLFSNYSQWQSANLKLKRALSFSRGVSRRSSNRKLAGAAWRLLDFPIGRISGQAVLVLAFSRGGPDLSLALREALALLAEHEDGFMRRSRSWLWFSAAGLALLFLCLALPNWIFFKSAGAPVWLGIALAAAIAWLLYQAFIVPFVLAGMSAALLAETNGKTCDQDLCEKLKVQFPDTVVPGKRAN